MMMLLKIKDEVYQEAKKLAKALGISLRELIEQALIEDIEATKKADREAWPHLRG